jgi:maleylacetoacetate isomerase
MSDITLYDYWRSSAAYRVRIALGLCGLDFDSVSINLLEGEHKGEAHLARNPQGFVPALEMDGQMMTQSVAIIEYLHEIHPEVGLLPATPLDRQRVRALSYATAMDIHPVCNLGVVKFAMGLGEDGNQIRLDWFHKFIGDGLAAYERMLEQNAPSDFSFDDAPTMADICLMPQLYNARRWEVDLSAMPRILAVEENCNRNAAFQAAHPDRFAPKN